ncbi:MAG: hypothetical protein ACXADU_19810 [Promethearchaeota archaeon]
MTNRRTLDNVSEWIFIIRQKTRNVPIVLAGTNADLDQQRKVSRDEGIWIAKKYQMDAFVEVSAKTGVNVSALFNVIIELLCRPPTHILEWRPPRIFPEDIMA